MTPLQTRSPAAGDTASGAKRSGHLGKATINKNNGDRPTGQQFLIGVYSGSERIGSIRRVSDHAFEAFDLAGVSHGCFRTLKPANAAVPGNAT